MTDKAINKGGKPSLKVRRESGSKAIVLTGSWDLRSLAAAPDVRKAIRRYAAARDVQWDISEVDLLDSAAAFILWQSWGEKMHKCVPSIGVCLSAGMPGKFPCPSLQRWNYSQWFYHLNPSGRG